jgi:outer membrane protein OmpA-like peptidoglycan-associated protein
MRRDFQLLAGASAVAAAIAIATQINRPVPTEAPPAVEQAPPLIAAQITLAADEVPAVSPEPDRTPELAAEITRLTASLHDREAELARLQASLEQRDADVDRVTAALAARDAEIRKLRQELETLQTQSAFDAKLAELKTAAAAEPADAPAPVATRLERTPAAAERPASADTLLTDIQFESASSRLTPGAHMRTLAAAAALDTMQLESIRVVGHADTVGNPERNLALSLARATTVAHLLEANGIAADLIDTAGMGVDDLPIATPAQTPEPLNRSVSIIAVPTRLAYAAP